MDTERSQSRLFIRACRGEKVDRIPVWMMRQAGRYQKEYRALKDRMGGFWGLSTNADAIAEATLFAQKSLETDAAIIFSDITVPAWAMGLELEFVPGPKFSTPVQTKDDVNRLQDYDPDVKTDFLMQGIAKTRAELPESASLIGFIGAPVTVAGYMIEGYPSRGWRHLKSMAYGQPELFAELLDRVSHNLIQHARAQVRAGCDAIQLFDSTAGELAPSELHHFAFGWSKKVVEGLKDLDVPIIYFARNISKHITGAAAVGADVLGVDWTLDLSEARRILGSKLTLMGNLDPTLLFCNRDVLNVKVKDILESVGHEPGFIFNLGHGILPETPPANVKGVVEQVHAFKP
jgi:uroporphyrinogen decarboxylase